MRVKIRDEGLVRNKAVYLALGVQADGTKDILGIWIETTEGAKFWLRVMNELKNRGVEDVLIAVVDGLKGFPEAINAVFPQAIVQTCVVHLIRHSLEFVSWKDRKPVVPALRMIYRATDAEAGRAALEAFDAGFWGRKYPAIAQAWRRNWDRVIPFFAFPEAVRKIVYTTDEMDKHCQARRGIFGPARTTSWRRAERRLQAPPGRLTRASSIWGVRAPLLPVASSIERRSARRHALRGERPPSPDPVAP